MPTQSDDDRATSPDLKPVIVFLAWMTVSYVAGFAVFEGTSQGLWFYYVSLNPPRWSPPTLAFTPIDTILYGCMGVAVWQAVREPSDVLKRNALVLFFFQLVLGVIWTWLFFFWHKTLLAVDFGYALVIVLLATTVLFWKIRRSAGALMLPVLAWTGYFSFVELMLHRMNP